MVWLSASQTTVLHYEHLKVELKLCSLCGYKNKQSNKWMNKPTNEQNNQSKEQIDFHLLSQEARTIQVHLKIFCNQRVHPG